jgi:DNA-directed RNA polymerase II subunit RPB2
MFSEDNVWKIFDAYYKENTPVSHQIDSFNDFVTFGMQEVVSQEGTIILPGYKLEFTQISLAPPQVIEEDRNIRGAFPSDARRRNLMYNSAMSCNITETYENGGKKDVKEHTGIIIGRMPVMLKSCICNLRKLSPQEQIEHGEDPNDTGGYFIIKGHERVLVAQIRPNYNQIFVLKQKPDEKHHYIAEVRSMSSETGHSVLVQAMIGSNNRSLSFSLPCIKELIPIGIVFKALGYITEEDICNIIGLNVEQAKRYLRYIIRDASICDTQKDALKYIGQYAMHTIAKEKEEQYAWQVVETELFPHLGISGSVKEQACFLGNIIRKLLSTVIGLRSEDDRDNLSAKRVEVAGPLINEIFRNSFKKYITFIKGQLEKRKQRPEGIPLITRIKSLTKILEQCFSTGNWGVQKNAAYVRMGVSQILDRMTYGASLSHMRRILIPVSKEGKSSPIRQIHSSHFGFICPSETPEGQKVGIVLNFSLFTKVSRKIPTVLVRRYLEECKMIILTDKMDIKNIKDTTSVFLNGILIGYTHEPENALEEIKRLRKIGFIDNEVSIVYDIVDNEIKVFCDEGRFMRPLLTVNENNALKIVQSDKYKWSKLVKKGYISYVDCGEVENSVVAMYPDMLEQQQSDYCEIHPCTLLGVMGSIIPFPDHSQSPRNCYQCSMGKQALGIPTYAYNSRTDTLLHVLHYPQRPIVSTKTSDYLGFNKMPSGINAIVGIACYMGYNQEDSLIVNRSATERGFGCMVSYRTIEECEKKCDTYSYQQICVPPQTTHNLKQEDEGYFRRKSGNYSLLDENGIIRSRIPYEKRCMNQSCKVEWFDGNCKCCPECDNVSTIRRGGGSIPVEKGDVIIGKVVVTGSKSGKETKIDVSRVIQEGEEGIIDRVHIHTTPNGYKLVKVVIRKNRKPELGDKFASREAQKGTIGAVLHESQMPFSLNSDIIPEIIINPLCMPSRMTVNQLIECALGKVSVVKGEYGDATPFTRRSTNIADKLMKEATDIMKKKGLNHYGWEKMINGITGEEMNVAIFMGPTYYQRLKHMVADKMHARAKGDVTTLTRQPVEGRSRDGGLRFGEMERDCMIAHGASRFLKERLFDVSDPFQVTVCQNCGIMTHTLTECQSCKGDNLAKVNFPYASKLLVQELGAMCLKVAIRARKN